MRRCRSAAEPRRIERLGQIDREQRLGLVEQEAPVAVGRGDQRRARIGGQRQRRSSTASARVEQFAERRRVEPVEDQHLRAAEQRGVELERLGFSVVAPTSDDRAVLDIGQEAVLLRAVEAVDLVDEQQGARARCAHARAPRRTAFLRSATPENTALIATKRSPTASASSRAIVVLPVPGGPHRIIDDSRPAATIRPIAPSAPVRCSCPTTSPARCGRSRSASGASDEGPACADRPVRGQEAGHRRKGRPSQPK